MAGMINCMRLNQKLDRQRIYLKRMPNMSEITLLTI